MHTVTIYSKADCHLCDIAKQRVLNIRRCLPFELEIEDITQDLDLYEKYQKRIPVVLVDGQEVFTYRVIEKQLRRLLKE